MRIQSRPTRFSGLGYAKTGNEWRFVDVETGAAIGPFYRTKAEMFGDMDAFALVRGFSPLEG